MKITALLFVSLCWTFSCTTGQNQSSDHTTVLSELTPEQKTAFDALNSLQIQMRESRLYSTFPGIHHDYFPSDSSFVLSRAELLIEMKALLAKYCTEIAPEAYNKLAANAVLAQEEYLVKECPVESMQMVDGVLTSVSIAKGAWILPKVLDRRDIVLVW